MLCLLSASITAASSLSFVCYALVGARRIAIARNLVQANASSRGGPATRPTGPGGPFSVRGGGILVLSLALAATFEIADITPDSNW
jgi:hypothetical protein